MKGVYTVVLCNFILAASILGQDKPVKIALKPTSSTPPAYLLDTLPKAGCTKVSIVLDESKADYVLEAQGGD